MLGGEVGLVELEDFLTVTLDWSFEFSLRFFSFFTFGFLFTIRVHYNKIQINFSIHLLGRNLFFCPFNLYLFHREKNKIFKTQKTTCLFLFKLKPRKSTHVHEVV